MRSLIGVAAAALLAILTGVVPEAVDPAQGRADSPAGLVRVDAMVEDGAGKAVSGLTREDFEVLSDGQPRPVASFAPSAAPLTVAVLIDVTASLHYNAGGVAGLPSAAPDGRHVASNLDETRKPGEIPVAVPEFPLKGVRRDDRVRLGAITSRLIMSGRFIGDSSELRKGWKAVFDLPPVLWLGPSPIWDAVAEATAWCAAEPGQRAIVMMTDGEASGNARGYLEVSAMAAAAGVSVSVMAEEAVLPHGVLPQLVALDIDPAMPLRAMADATGGAYVFDPANYWLGKLRQREDSLKRIFDRLHHTYALGFVPAALDGKPHTLEIRVRKPGVTVRARKMFAAR